MLIFLHQTFIVILLGCVNGYKFSNSYLLYLSHRASIILVFRVIWPIPYYTIYKHPDWSKLNFSESLNTIKQSFPDNTYYLLNCCSCVINYSSERSLIGFPEQEEVLPSRTPGPNVLFRNPLSFSFLFFLSPTRFDEFHFPF